MDVYEVNPDLQEWSAALICILCVKLPIWNLGLDSSYSNLFHLGSNESRVRFDNNGNHNVHRNRNNDVDCDTGITMYIAILAGLHLPSRLLSY